MPGDGSMPGMDAMMGMPPYGMSGMHGMPGGMPFGMPHGGMHGGQFPMMPYGMPGMMPMPGMGGMAGMPMPMFGMYPGYIVAPRGGSTPY